MKQLAIIVLVVAVALAVAGCEACNGGLTGSSSNIADQIQRKVEGICGKDRSSARGGVDNIMLMDGHEDDGIVTCHDGTNHFFDA